MIAALRRNEVPPGGLRLPGVPAAAQAATAGASRSAAAGAHFSGMPPPPAGAYGTPFGGAAAQRTPLQKGKAPPPAVVPAPKASGHALIGRKLQRYFPDSSPSWVTGTIISYNPASGQHEIQFGPPIKIAMKEVIDDIPPQNIRWVEVQEAPPPPPPPPPASKANSSKPSTSKSGLKSAPSTPRPPPMPKPPPAPVLNLPGGPSTFNAVGLSIMAPPYNDQFLRNNLPKNRTEDLFAMLGAMDEREAALVRDMAALLDDPADVAEINRLLEQTTQLGQREQQLRAELRELGVTG